MGNGISKRNSSIELLRILSMIIIVFHHFAVHSGFEWELTNLSIPRFWYNFIIMGGKIGVDLFVLISGYFLILSKEKLFNLRRILKIWGQLAFYSVSIYLLFGICGITHIGIRSFILSFFPITYDYWWFASTYFVLYLFHPFLNRLLHSLDKKNYQILILLFVLCWSIIPTFTNNLLQSNNLLWFMTLYCISGYIRLYGFHKKLTSKQYWMLWGLFTLLTYGISVVFTLLSTKWSDFSFYILHYYEQEKLTTLLISLSLFMAFASMKINYNKWINRIASATFGVYLIHDSHIVRPFLWGTIFKNAQFQDSLMLIPYSILVVAIVYILCTMIDLIRQRVFEKPFLKFVDKHSKQLTTSLMKITEICRRIVFGKENKSI